MKNENEFEHEELLKAWLKEDAQLANDNLEDIIMMRIAPKADTVRKTIKIPKAVIITGYCLLTFATLGFCFWKIDMFAQFQIPISEWHPVAESERYYNRVIIGVGIVALLCIAGHWRFIGYDPKRSRRVKTDKQLH